MLILSRKENDRVHIGDDIVITITKIQGGKVRLGIDAPKDTVIVRDELIGQNVEDGRLSIERNP